MPPFAVTIHKGIGALCMVKRLTHLQEIVFRDIPFRHIFGNPGIGRQGKQAGTQKRQQQSHYFLLLFNASNVLSTHPPATPALRHISPYDWPCSAAVQAAITLIVGSGSGLRQGERVHDGTPTWRPWPSWRQSEAAREACPWDAPPSLTCP